MKFPRKSPRSHDCAFTLVELLTVIAIIGVLAGILIPVTINARSLGRQTRCAANLRQIGVQLLSYAQENRGVTIVAYDSPQKASWQTILAVRDGTYEHLTNQKPGEGADYGIWRCPENSVQDRVVSGANIGEEHCSYGINGWANSEAPQGQRYTGAHVAAIANPSKLYMLTEACYFRMEPEKTNGQGTIPSNLYASGPSYLRYAHGGKLNMVYADGHIELLGGPLLGRGTFTGNSSASLANRFSNGAHWYSE
jgi:prepilin-type N-terminal cleavage/methylation domain-containing protein/prepilin-type processing-associated H-X9-DG protein